MKKDNFLKSAYLLSAVTLLIFLPLSVFIVLELLMGIFGYSDINIFLKEHGSLLAGFLALLAAIGAILFQNWNTTRQIQANQCSSEKNRFNDKKEVLYKVAMELEAVILGVSEGIPKDHLNGDIAHRSDNKYFIHSSYGIIARFNDLKVIVYQYDFMRESIRRKYIDYINLYIKLLTASPEKLSELADFAEGLNIAEEAEITSLVNDIRSYVGEGVNTTYHNGTIKIYLHRINAPFKLLSKEVIEEVVAREYNCD